MEIRKDDIIKVILQFLKEGGYNNSYETLQNESGVSLNLVDSKQQLLQDVINGKWDSILRQIKHFKLDSEILMDIYEIIVCELVEINETQVANQLFKDLMGPLMKDQQERLLRLDYLIRKPGKLELSEIYLDNLSKEQRRRQVGDRLCGACVETKASRLIELLGDALKHRMNTKIMKTTQQLDLFLDEQLTEQSEQTYRIEKVIKYSEKMRVNCATYSNDGMSLITGSIDGIIEVWDTQLYQVRKDLDYQLRDEFMGHTCAIIDLSVTDQLLASLDIGGCIKVWKLKSGKQIKKPDVNLTKQLTSILLGKDTSHLFVSAHDIVLYGLKSGVILKSFRGHTANVIHMLQSIEGSRLYSTSGDGTLKVWDINTQEQVFSYNCNASVETILLTPTDPKYLLVCSRSNTIRLLAQSFNEIRQYTNQECEFVACATSKSSVYGLTNQNSICVYDLATGKADKLIKLPGNVAMGILRNNRNQLFVYCATGELIFIQ